ncbi:internal virion protein with endolysin domain protein [Variovorax phage VAC_51]|uniref:Internal virion protein with endolysin domain protein n=1 Tax=Variovorax phage VAC_51 TaxID=2985242 RepID=A0A9N6WU01_9CAUD|nr:internal virion protein with endolysin domain protein [Variovorax phage VAC_51]
MEPITNVDPRIYGGEAPNTREVPTIDPLAARGGGAVPQPYEAPAKVSQDAIGAGTSAVLEGQQAIAQANRKESTIGESSLAAVKSWSTTRVWDYMNAPKFTYDPEFDPKPFIRNAPVALTETEHKFLASSKSEEEYQFRLTNLQDQRKLYEQMGDHPFISGAIGIVDPVYLAIDIASMGTASVATRGLGLTRAAGRVIAGTEAAGLTLAVGKTEQQVAAVGDSEIVFNALLNGAASAAFFNPKTRRMEKVDPEYPSDALHAAATRTEKGAANIEKRVQAENVDVTATMVAERKGVAAVEAAGDVPVHRSGKPLSDAELAPYGFKNLGAESDAYVLLARHEADPMFGTMIKQMREEFGDQLSLVKVREGDVARAAYFHGNGTMYLKTGATAFTALHEAIHGLTVNKLRYGAANPGTAHGRLVTELEGLRKQVADHIAAMKPQDRPRLFKQDGDKGASYFTTNVDEFVAGLFAGKADQFTRVLASIPAAGAKNALAKMVDVVRKLLGIAPNQESALTRALGLTDELMRTKLAVKAEDGSIRNFAPAGTPQQVNQQVAGWWERAAKKSGSKLEWSLNREMRAQGTEGNRVADLLVDDPVNMTGNSAVSQRQAIRAELAQKQAAFEDKLKEVMAEQGAGIRQRIFNSANSMRVQQRIENQVAEELARRDNAVARGVPVTPAADVNIGQLADLHDAATAAALREGKAAGVKGMETLAERSGYAPRKWDITKLEAAEGAFRATGMSERQARKAVRDLISEAITRRDGTIPRDIADDMAQAVTERTRRKGYFEDAANTGTMGDDGAQGIRAILQGSGLDSRRMQQIEDFMTGRKDDAGVMSSLKDRIPMDMTTSMQMPDGKTLRMLDLTDNSVVRNLDGYLDDMAGQAGLARKGLVSSSDITKLRGEFLEGIENEAQRRSAAALFDNTIKAIKGQPVGEELGKRMRQLSAITTSVGLANSGMWQLMEYANVATKYGMVRTTKEMLARMPVAKALFAQVKGNVDEAGSMAYVLSHNSTADLRIRPFVTKLEDNFTIPVDDRLTLALQQSKQLVPYINAMKYVHHAQANMTANLITDLVQRGAKGNAGAREMLAKYGLEGHQLDRLKTEIDTHGMIVDKWSDGAWADVRGPLNKMMDDTVLKNRTGELPSFAQFSTLGKFIFTFRSFVLGSHNKVLAGTLGRHGFAGMGLLMAYQFPLSMATTYAVGATRGKPEEDMGKLATGAVSQMSAFGMIGELAGVMSGQKQQFGSSGLMAIDRLYKTTSQAAQGNFAQAGTTLAQTVPLLAILPGIKALAEQTKN